MGYVRTSCALACALGALMAAQPAAAEELLSTDVTTADAGKWRRCHDGVAPSGASAVTTRRVTTAHPGLVWATLDGPGSSDWDVAIFEATSGRLVAGSAGPDTNEVAEGFVASGQELIVQSCLVDGDPTTPHLNVGYADTREDASTVETIQLVRVNTPSSADKNRLQGLGLDLTEHGGNGFVEAVLYSAADEAKLTAAGFTWTVRIADLAARERENRAADARFARETRASGMPSGNDEYRRLPDYEADLKELAMQNPGLVRLFTMPHQSLEGRDIVGVEITTDVNNTQDGKPVFAQMGVHHAREWPSGEHAIEWAHELVNGFNAGDAQAVDLVSRVRTIDIPVVNVDGFNLSREAPVDLGPLGDVHPLGYTAAILADPGFAFKRRNCRVEDGRAPDEGECAQRQNRDLGTDPNRNYGALWGGPGASTDPGVDTYRGAGPFSEPETQNIHELVSSRQVTTLITNHTFSGLVLRAPGVRAQGPAPDEDAMRALGARMTSQNGYTNQKGYQLYDTTGTTEDWSYNATGGYGYTFEIGPDEFHPPFEETVAEYQGTRGYEGKGNRGAYWEAMQNTADRSQHSVLEGSAPAGAVLRIQKDFMTNTHDPKFLDDDGTTTEPGSAFPDHLESSLVVPASGSFEWDVNPSTRPAVAERSYTDFAETPSRTEEFDNTTPSVPGGGATDQPFYYTEHEFTLTDSDPTKGLIASIDGEEGMDLDAYLYRENADGTRQLVGSSAGGTADETAIAEDVAPGKYVLRVVNYTSPDFLYTGSFAVYGPGPVNYRAGTKEAWVLSCERPDGTVVDTQKVFVDRGQRLAVTGLCTGGSATAAAPDTGGVAGLSAGSGALRFRMTRSVRLSRSGTLSLPVSCPAGGAACKGVLSVYIERKAAATKRARIGRKAFSVAAGKRAVIRVKVTRRYRAYLRKRRTARAIAVAGTRSARFRIRA